MPAKKFCILLFSMFSFFYFFLSLFNFSFTNLTFNYIFCFVYFLLALSCILYDMRSKNIKFQYFCGFIGLMIIPITNDYFIEFIALFLLIYAVIRVDRFKWLYILFLCLFILGTILSSLALRFGVTIEENTICAISPSGEKALMRDIRDIGALGYSVHYYIAENHGVFSHKYLVASRGKYPSDWQDSYFIDENTLYIQGITYDISGKDVVFEQPETNEIIHRKKRKNILWFL